MNEETTHVDCREVLDRLWAYIDGELTPQSTSRISEHLEACKQCCPCHDYHRAFLAFVRQHAQQPVPPGLRRKVFEQLLALDAASGAG